MRLMTGFKPSDLGLIGIISRGRFHQETIKKPYGPFYDPVSFFRMSAITIYKSRQIFIKMKCW